MGIDLLGLSDIDRNDPAVRAAGADFDELADLLVALVEARKNAGLRQADVARIMGTTQSVVSDFERIGGNPTIRTLQSYARSVGCRIRLTLEPREHAE